MISSSPKALLRLAYRQAHATFFRILRWLGWNITRTADFYSPLPVLEELADTRDGWDRPSELVGVSYDLERMKRLLSRLVSARAAELGELPDHQEIKTQGYGPGFPLLDAWIVYLMIRDLKPKRYIEIGSGLSTYYSWRAAERNRQAGAACEMSCIDPFPTGRLWSLPGIAALESKVEAVDLELFSALDANDVLFIDSTHVLRVGGDVAFLFLEVLPRLRPGVVVHMHDIPFPYNTPHPAEKYVFRSKWPLYRTEPMILQAFLSYNSAFEILLSTPMIRHFEEAFLEQTIPGYRGLDTDDYDTHFGSIWLMRS